MFRDKYMLLRDETVVTDVGLYVFGLKEKYDFRPTSEAASASNLAKVSVSAPQFRESRRVESENSEPIPESEAVAEVLNTAPRSELMGVDGIGKGTAKRIINNRPYETEEEVLQEGILPEEIVERVKEQLADKNRDVA